MRIPGIWFPCDDGITRPILVVRLRTASGSVFEEKLLVDGGADRTVFSANVLGQLGATTMSGGQLAGVGGMQSSVLVQTVLELRCDDGTWAVVRGQFAALTDPSALDMSVLGRDVLNNFDLIMSRPRDEVCLLAPPHRYLVHSN